MRIVGRYELLEPIGHGGMAVVYLARQTDLDRQVALKELRMFQAPDDPSLAERFLREARVAGSLSHPNIVTVHEYFKHEGTPYIAMEYLQRGSLRPWVGRMTVAQIAGVLEGLLAALDQAERYHIVHRDLKPENILVTDQGQVKVADFGIAKARTMNTNAMLTAAGTTVGTPTYMAPEQAMAQELGPYTDLYSVGVMAYELFVGKVPFHDSDTPVAIIMRHVNEEIPPARTVNPSLDPALSDWIDRLLVKDPTRRTQTAEEAWEQLEEVVLALVGSPRWRRGARLVETLEQPAARPLTPAPFTSTDVETPLPPQAALDDPPESTSGEFQSFAWGQPAAQVSPEAVAAAMPSPEPAPAPVEPVPEVAEDPAPEPEPVAVVEPAPPAVEPAPSAVEPAPSAVEPPPPAVEAAPSAVEPPPPAVEPPAPVESAWRTFGAAAPAAAPAAREQPAAPPPDPPPVADPARVAFSGPKPVLDSETVAPAAAPAPLDARTIEPDAVPAEPAPSRPRPSGRSTVSAGPPVALTFAPGPPPPAGRTGRRGRSRGRGGRRCGRAVVRRRRRWIGPVRAEACRDIHARERGSRPHRPGDLDADPVTGAAGGS